MAFELGLAQHGERCQACPVFDRCDYRLDIAADPELRALYLEAEDVDGYYRDRCVFAEDISIEDTMQVHAVYANGVSLNYTLCAYSPWEGFEIKFYGTRGELTHRHVEVHGVFGGQRDKAGAEEAFTTVLHEAGGRPRQIEVWTGSGDHGGADPVMLGYLFDPDREADRYRRRSSHIDGAWSILTGIAANGSMESGGTVDVDQLLAENGISLPRSW
jgi:hypothetical protein